MVTPLIAHT